jgi:hypothetical protein
MTPKPGRQSDEMLAAYVDGVSELTSAEREGIEAQLRDHAELRTEELATRNLLGELRELGTAERDRAEPSLDWAAMERSIRNAVGPEVPHPWWRRWRFMIPGMATLAVATAILVVIVRTPSAELVAPPPPVQDAAVAIHKPDPVRVAVQTDESAVVWLDGMDVALGPEADAVLDDLEAKDLRDVGSPLGGVELVVSDLGWVDDLDESELDGIERALENEATRRKKG